MMKQQQTATAGKGRNALLAASVFFLVGIIFWGGFNTAMEATNTLDFCISCHEMESTVYQEYRHSVHYLNASGVQATCPDCHVPREWTARVVRKIKASRELYHWLTGEIDSREKFEAKRQELATRVWDAMQENGSQECRNCHQFSVMDMEGQPRFAARSHADALQQGKTCIDCHKGIAHHMPEPAVTVAESDIDVELGEEINATCAGCHGEFGEGSIDGEYPRLAGLDVEYLARQLRHFKQRERLNIPMVPFTTERELPEEDLLAVAAYLSGIQLPTRLPPVDDEAEFNALERLRASKLVVNIAPYPGKVAAGRKLYRDECAGCHGRDAYGDTGHTVPPLAGQHSLYLFRQVEKFRSGERLHDDPRDAGTFSLFSDTEINDILAYLTTLDD
jgi:nitrate/TMAO reductase-like tetraheme cytochrome c subunit